MDNKIIVIHHDDADGYVSAAVVHRYLTKDSRFCVNDQDILFMEYDYGRDTTEIDKQLSFSDNDIYILDVTLPNELMVKYAERITWIDHHINRINDTSPEVMEWKNKLNHNVSRVHLTQEEKDAYMTFYLPELFTPDGVDCKLAACELTYLYFYSYDTIKGAIPTVIMYTGRYDSWNHNNNGNILGFNTGIRSVITSARKNNGERDLVKYISDRLFNDLEFNDIATKGSERLKHKKAIYEDEASDYIRKVKIRGSDATALVVNRPSVGSQYFESMLTEDVDVLMTFYFNLKENQWKGSIYTNPLSKSGVSALNILDHIKICYNNLVNEDLRNVDGTKFSDVLNGGGHKDACGWNDNNISWFIFLLEL